MRLLNPMHPLEKSVAPDPDGFGQDPFGYSALAWHKWGMAQTMAGYPLDISERPSATDLKSPVLWMTHERIGDRPRFSNRIEA
jgi:hypothetical protein